MFNMAFNGIRAIERLFLTFLPCYYYSCLMLTLNKDSILLQVAAHGKRIHCDMSDTYNQFTLNKSFWSLHTVYQKQST